MPMDSAQFGQYQLLYPLGAGGMGQVFLARHQGENEIQRMVAVKRILSHLSRRKKLVNLFLDEVRVASQLNHGNIVQVIDHGLIDKQYYMAMEYIHGENLMEVLLRLDEQGKNVPVDLLLYIISCVCAGLDHAHRKQALDGKPLNIVHRDISPQNILLSFDGEVKIADFGVARAAEQTHETIGGELRGKISYMSPEQAHGHPLDHRSDLFALGIVIYESLTGRAPFLRDNPMATLEAVRAGQVIALDLVRSDLPLTLIKLVHKLLAKDREDRPQSAREIHQALHEIIREEQRPVTAFDLADYMHTLFPESKGRETTPPPAEELTKAGRRADQLLLEAKNSQLPTQANVRGIGDIERRTLFYLQKRHPEGMTLARELWESRHGASQADELKIESNSARSVSSAPRGTWLAVMVVLFLGLGSGASYYVYRLRSATSVDSRPDSAASQKGQADSGSSTDLATARADGSTTSGPDQAIAHQVDGGRTQPPSVRKGRLSIGTRPDNVAVTLNRRPIGTSPLTRSLRPGKYELTFSLIGYRTMTREVRVSADRTTPVKITMVPLLGTLRISSSVPCKVTINGRAAGDTPLAGVKVPPGKLTIKCMHKMRAIGIRRIQLAPGQLLATEFHFGYLSVADISPPATVAVDGQARGETPLRLLLAAGDHQVTLTNTSGKQRKRVVEIKSGKTTRISSW
jgi:serine/threonine protein kinase